MKLHNLKHFNHALKLSWLKRLLSSQGKWRYLVSEDFDNVFKYGVDYLDRLIEVTTIPFWRDVIVALKKLWKSYVVTNSTWVLHTPVWYSPNFRLQIVPEWNKKGIKTVRDFLTSNRSIMTQSIFENYYSVKTNFLEYGRVKNGLKDFLMDKEMPVYDELNPQNNIIDMIISQDRKGLLNLYRAIHGKSSDIPYNICSKWDLKAPLSLNTTAVRKSFIQTYFLFDDVYLKYIQFCTLHYRFFTNDMLKKCNIKQSDVCDFCKEESDSNLHILINCNNLKARNRVLDL